MRTVRYAVAMSLDGFIAGPAGEADWIVMDPAIDFAAFTARFDALLIGRRTYEPMARAGRGGGGMEGMEAFVCSRTLRPAEHPGVTIVPEAVPFVADLKERPGRDVWLFGGGRLFRSLAGAGLVDAVEVAVVPVLLGGGTPLLPAPSPRMRLALRGHTVYPTGIVGLEYAVVRE